MNTHILSKITVRQCKRIRIISNEIGWQCLCSDFVYRHVKCKHVFAIEFSLELRKKAEITKIEPITNATDCIFCHSAWITKGITIVGLTALPLRLP
jgi:hypothetical protein